ncbi:hypothetical protein U27_03515 [Candidatus Vecturithrix granuli]|uniref:Uncharacterized protein n=1 Tax=Vecturithrix granuli TaxID=1499967 RepID=A0A081BW48_VECG1|nr:hypothetical protein U27_03515 [Candidatus Vecturithrix granuli]
MTKTQKGVVMFVMLLSSSPLKQELRTHAPHENVIYMGGTYGTTRQLQS